MGIHALELSNDTKFINLLAWSYDLRLLFIFRDLLYHCRFVLLSLDSSLLSLLKMNSISYRVAIIHYKTERRSFSLVHGPFYCTLFQCFHQGLRTPANCFHNYSVSSFSLGFPHCKTERCSEGLT
jgi:hypothetical protein